MLGQLFSYTKTEYSIPGLSFVLGAVLVLMVVVVVSVAVSWCYQQLSIMKALDAAQNNQAAQLQYRINASSSSASTANITALAPAGGPPPAIISNYVGNNPAAVSSSMIALPSSHAVVPDQYLHHHHQLVMPPPLPSSSLSSSSSLRSPPSPQAQAQARISAGVAAEDPRSSQDPSCVCIHHPKVEKFVSVLMPGDQIPSFMARPISKEEDFEYAPHLTKDVKLTSMHE